MSNKLDIFPYAATIDNSGHLALHGHRAKELATQYGTPLYVYDVETIRHQLAAYRRGLSAYRGQTRLTYASKAFQCTALAQFMTQEKVWLDVASAGEIFIAQNGGANPAEMHMHGNNKTAYDLQTALEAGVGRIVVDNEDELYRLAKMAQARQQFVKIWLRITPGIAVETHQYILTGASDSKFGFSLKHAKEIAKEIISKHPKQKSENPLEFLQLTGLHVHLGSHFHDAEPVGEAMDCLLDLANSLHKQFGWELKELCAGGGWGVRYHPDDPPKPIEPYVSGVVAAVEISCRRKNLLLPTLILEPGRSIVAQAGVAIYTVGGRKVIPEVRTYVSIDGGLADNPRPALYQAQYTALLANRGHEPESETVAIAGPFCESGDILIQSVTLPPAKAGDILAVPVSGAYQLSMGTNYNAALRPAVIFIEENKVKLVQRREMLSDLIKRDK